MWIEEKRRCIFAGYPSKALNKVSPLPLSLSDKIGALHTF